MADQGNPLGTNSLHLLEKGLNDELAQAATLHLGGDSKRMHADDPATLQMANVALALDGLPLLGKSHGFVRNNLGVRSRCDDVSDQNALGTVGAVALDWVGEFQSREHVHILNLARHDGLKDTQAQLGAGAQSVLNLRDLSENHEPRHELEPMRLQFPRLFFFFLFLFFLVCIMSPTFSAEARC